MNCKPGDLAVIVRTSATTTHTLGAVVTVEEAGPPGFYGESLGLPGPVPVWWCRFSRPVKAWDGTVADLFRIPDACLRALRPGADGEEDLTWAGKPEGVAA